MTKPPSDPDDETSVDPMLLFAVETDAGQPEEPDRAPVSEAETFAESADYDVAQPPATPMATDMRALDGRLCEVERALEQSANDAGELKAQLATLVITVGEISARVHERVEVAVPTRASSPPASNARRTGSRATMAWLAAAVAGVAVVVWFLQSDAAQTPVPAMEPLQAADDPASGPAVEPAEGPAESADESVLADAPDATDLDESPAAEVSPAASPPPPERAVPQGGQEAAPAPARSAPFVGTLSIASVPADATVFLNREPVGTAPIRLQGLRAGSHLVWVEREGFRRWTRVVLVPANQVTRVSVELESLPRP